MPFARSAGLSSERFGWPVTVGLAIVAAGLLCTFALARSSDRSSEELDARRYQSLEDSAIELIRDRLDAYDDALISAASYHTVSGDISREEWRSYAGRVALGDRYPGLEGIGVVYPVGLGEEDLFEAGHSIGSPGFAVRPVPGYESQAVRYVVTYIEPAGPNDPMIGLDVGSEGERRMAAERARDTGRGAISGRVSLVTDPNRPAFLFFVPFYHLGMPIDTVDQRREAIAGWVYAPCFMEEFFAGIFGSDLDELDVHVFDGGGPDPDRLVFDDSAHTGSDQGGNQSEDSEPIVLRGQLFTIGFSRGAGFVSAGHAEAIAIRAFGSLASLALAAMVWAVLRSRGQARRAADAAIEELRQHSSLHDAIVGGTAYAVISCSPDGVVTSVNPAAEEMLGYDAAELLHTRGLESFYAVDELERLDAELPAVRDNRRPGGFPVLARLVRHDEPDDREWTFIRKSESTFPARVSLSALVLPDGTVSGYVALVRDVTREKEFQESESRLAAIVSGSGDGILSVDLNRRVTTWNAGAERLYGYEAAEMVGESVWRLVPPSRAEEASEIPRAIARADTLRLETVRFRKDGSEVEVSETVSPLFDAAGRVSGAALIVRDVSEQVASHRRMEELLEAMHANSVALSEQAVELDALRAQAVHLANHDALTGLLNRRAWFERAEEGGITAIAIFDIDFFKNVNDSHGHPAGDTVLREVSRRLEVVTGEEAIVGRVGGEEFGILFTGPFSRAMRLAQRCVDNVGARPVSLAGDLSLTVTLSGGLASCQGGTITTIEQAYEVADGALYRAKAAGRRRLEVHRDERAA